MVNARLTPTIGGREAIPVRAIPYITGWDISSDQVAKSLAQRESAAFSWLTTITAFHIRAGGSPVPVLPKEWDAVVVRLEALEADIRSKHPERPQGYAAWRLKSAEQLPSGVFIWLDEFEREYVDQSVRERLRTEYSRPGDGAVTFAPMAVPEIWDMVFAGFADVRLREAYQH